MTFLRHWEKDEKDFCECEDCTVIRDKERSEKLLHLRALQVQSRDGDNSQGGIAP